MDEEGKVRKSTNIYDAMDVRMANDDGGGGGIRIGVGSTAISFAFFVCKLIGALAHSIYAIHFRYSFFVYFCSYVEKTGDLAKCKVTNRREIW